MKFGLTASAIKQICEVLSKHGKIQKVKLYGSRALGTFRPGSDIDLSFIAPEMDTTELLKIENELEELSLPYKFDLSLLHQIDNQNLVDQINRVGVDFCAD